MKVFTDHGETTTLSLCYASISSPQENQDSARRAQVVIHTSPFVTEHTQQ